MIKEGYTRVTDVLFPLSGLKAIDPVVLHNAAVRGQRVHEIIDALISDIGVMDIKGEHAGYIDSFQQWLPGHKFIQKPDRFYCDKYMITGEVDCIYKTETGLAIVDFKTPAKESKTWRLQGSAYSYLAKQAGYKIDKIEFVRLDKKGGKAKSYFYEEDFDMYLKCLDVFRYFFAIEENEKADVLDYL